MYEGYLARTKSNSLHRSRNGHRPFIFLICANNEPLCALRVNSQSAYSHHGERVVVGQRAMQLVSDIFLGWVTAPNGRQFYVRQLHDAKIKPMVETFNSEMLDVYARACGWALAHAHAKISEISATISGYLGSSSDEFDEAIGEFALA
jgi:hypothetical protein